MSCPIMHNIIVGGIISVAKRSVDYHQTNILFHDYYPELYQRFGIERSEMMIVMPAIMTVDPLCGCEKLKYIGEVDSS